MTVVTMKPSAWRTVGALMLGIGGCMAASGFTAGGAQFWARTGEMLAVTAFFFAFVWIAFVPMQLEFDRVELTIRYLLRRSRTTPWSELELYGDGRGTFMLQFEGQTYQIFSAAFSSRDWWQLTNFLSTRFPECKADGWAGASLFKWRGK
jgi:hypothetical protein